MLHCEGTSDPDTDCLLACEGTPGCEEVRKTMDKPRAELIGVESGSWSENFCCASRLCCEVLNFN